MSDANEGRETPVDDENERSPLECLKDSFKINATVARLVGHYVDAIEQRVNARADVLGEDADVILRHLREITTISVHGLNAFRERLISDAHVGADAITELDSIAEAAAEGITTSQTSALMRDKQPKRPPSPDGESGEEDLNHEETNNAAPMEKAKTGKKRREKKAPSSDDEQQQRNVSGAEQQNRQASEDDPDAFFTEEDWEIIEADFRISSDSTVVATTTLNRNVPHFIDHIIFNPSQPHLEAIPLLARNYLRVVSTLGEYANIKAQVMVLQCQSDLTKAETAAKKLQADALPALRGATTVGEFLCAMPEEDKEEEGELEDNDEDDTDAELAKLTEKLLVLKRAIYRHDNNGTAASDEVQVSDTRLQQVVKAGCHTTRLVRHLFHIALQHEAYCRMKLRWVLCNHSDDKLGEAMYKRATLLAKALGKQCDENTTTSEYHATVLLPALASDDHRDTAVLVIVDVYKWTTETRSQKRRKMICNDGYRPAELKRLDGGASENGVAYCSSNSKLHVARRKRMCTAYWLFSLKVVIERLESVTDYFPYGHTESILLLSASLLDKHCTFILTKTIGNGCFDAKDEDNLKDLAKTMKDQRNDGKRTIVIDSDVQLESLGELAIPR